MPRRWCGRSASHRQARGSAAPALTAGRRWPARRRARPGRRRRRPGARAAAPPRAGTTGPPTRPELVADDDRGRDRRRAGRRRVAEGRRDPPHERERLGARQGELALPRPARVVVAALARRVPRLERRAAEEVELDRDRVRPHEPVPGREAAALERLPEPRREVVPAVLGQPAPGDGGGLGGVERADEQREVRRDRVRREQRPGLGEVGADRRVEEPLRRDPQRVRRQDVERRQGEVRREGEEDGGADECATADSRGSSRGAAGRSPGRSARSCRRPACSTPA